MSPRSQAAIHRRLTEDHEQMGAPRATSIPFATPTAQPQPLKTPEPAAKPEPFERAREQAHLFSVRPNEVLVPETTILAEAIALPGTTAVPEARVALEPPPPRRIFPYHEFASSLDPAVVKARHLVGPIDPLILFIGDLDERHGPDLLIRAMPQLLKRHAQARLVIVGDGTLLWPLKVMSRYMLLDYAVRIVGHLGGQPVRELVAAADIVAVPSRVETEDWQILAGWSARRPVVATAPVTHGLCRHEHNSLVVTPEAAALLAGLDRVLAEPELGRRLGEEGHCRLLAEFCDAPDTEPCC